MTTTVTEPERASESNVKSGDPPEKREAIKKIIGMLPEFDPAFVDRLADRLKEELSVLPPTEPPTGCDEIPTPAECKRIKALYPEIDLSHENLWYNVCDAFDGTIGEHGWKCLLDVAEFVKRWTPGGTHVATPDDLIHRIDQIAVMPSDIRKRVNRIAGLVQAACICEHTYREGDKFCEPIDYCSAISGTIRNADGELHELQLLLNDAPEGGAV